MFKLFLKTKASKTFEKHLKSPVKHENNLSTIEFRSSKAKNTFQSFKVFKKTVIKHWKHSVFNLLSFFLSIF